MPILVGKEVGVTGYGLMGIYQSTPLPTSSPTTLPRKLNDPLKV